MSLVRSADLAPTSYENAKLFSLKGTDVRPGLSSQIFGPDKHRSTYMTDTYPSESYEKYFHDSQTEEIIEPSSSSISGSSIHPDVASSYQIRAISGASMVANNPFDSSFMSTRHRDAYQSNSGSDLMENGSLDSRNDDGLMRLKLQALERALLDDSDAEEEEEEEEDIFEAAQSMEIDPDIAEWADSMQNMLLHDSPKETSSSDSNISSISSTKEISQTSQNPRKLLYECAIALSEGNEVEGSSMINNLRQMVSIQGEPSQRIAAYMVEGLAARLAESGKSIYKALRCKEPPTSDRLAAMQILFEVCPCFKFVPAGLDRGYIVLNRPWAFVQWLEKTKIEEEYVLMAEPDHIFLRPLPNLAFGGHPAAFPFFYIRPDQNEKTIRKFYPEELGPVTNVDPIGNSPVIIRKDLIAKIAPTWMNISLKMKEDPETDKAFGWVLEMYAYAVASAVHGVRHILRKDFMLQPPWDLETNKKYILHYTYGCDYNMKGELTYGKIGEWRFDKRSHLRGPPPKNLPLPPPGVPESVVTLVKMVNEASANIPNWDSSSTSS